MIAGIKHQHREKVKKILEVASKVISKADDDGMGYAAITSKGKIYGEKWRSKEFAFKLHAQPKPDYSELFLEDMLGEAGKWKNKIGSELVYGRFGNMTKEAMNDTVAVLLHSRKATVGDKSIANTHPFYEVDSEINEDTAIIHNGSISNHFALTKKHSTCDSEVILHEYLKYSMNFNPGGVEDVTKALKGEYTVGVLSSMLADDDKTPLPILDIFKHGKDLHVGYCPEIETAIFSTWDMHLEEIAKETGFEIKNIGEVRDGYLLRLNAITGYRIEDLIEFTGSAKEVYPTGANGRGVSTNPGPTEAEVIDLRNRPKVTEDDIEETLEVVKQNFESNNSDLFSQKYQIPVNLSEAEHQFMLTLAKAGNTNLRALKLVQKVLGVKLEA